MNDSKELRAINKVSRALDREIQARQIAATNRLAAAIERHADALYATDETWTDLVALFNSKVVRALENVAARPVRK
jgi:hypothetical protein